MPEVKKTRAIPIAGEPGLSVLAPSMVPEPHDQLCRVATVALSQVPGVQN